MHKNSEEINKHISNYSLNKYSKFSNNYLNDAFCDYILEQFKEIYLMKRPKDIVYDENAFFVINTLMNIYNHCDTIENKKKVDLINDTINDFCDKKLIIGVIDCLFSSIEKNECDMIKM